MRILCCFVAIFRQKGHNFSGTPCSISGIGSVEVSFSRAITGTRRNKPKKCTYTIKAYDNEEDLWKGWGKRGPEYFWL